MRNKSSYPASMAKVLQEQGDTVGHILHGMVWGLWEAAWLDGRDHWADEHCKQGAEVPKGCPDPPDEVMLHAASLWGRVSQLNKMSPVCLLAMAKAADGMHDEDIADAEYCFDFGWCLAMQSLGHGVSWFDDHEQFEMETPDVEFYVYFDNPKDPNDCCIENCL